MKKTKILVGAMALSMVIPMMSINSFAATGSATTPVTYDSSNEIPDPDNPINPEWAVVVPAAINFSDTNGGRNVKTDVSIITKNGATELPGGASTPDNYVEVTLKSDNAYTLYASTQGVDDMTYEVKYAGTPAVTLDSTNPDAKTGVVIGQLSDTTQSIAGLATLKGAAKISGSHTDQLTYTVELKTN